MSDGSQPKYSIEPLPGDSLEALRTKALARLINAVRKKQGLTSAQLASRAGWPLSRVNALFAGKRVSISVFEVEQMAAALRWPTMALLWPNTPIPNVSGVQTCGLDVLSAQVEDMSHGAMRAVLEWLYFSADLVGALETPTGTTTGGWEPGRIYNVLEKLTHLEALRGALDAFVGWLPKEPRTVIAMLDDFDRLDRDDDGFLEEVAGLMDKFRAERDA